MMMVLAITIDRTIIIYLMRMIYDGHRDDIKQFNFVGVPVAYVGTYDWK